MSNIGLSLTIKDLPSQMVAGIRFTGHIHQIGPTLCSLYDEVKRYIRGKPMCLYHARDARKIRRDIEACFPVVYPVNHGPVRSHFLDGGTMLCMQYGGPNGSSHSLRTVNEAWMWFRNELEAEAVPIATGPRREVYFAESENSTHDVQGYVTELQIPIILSPKTERFIRDSGVRCTISRKPPPSEISFEAAACVEEDTLCVMQRL